MKDVDQDGFFLLEVLIVVLFFSLVTTLCLHMYTRSFLFYQHAVHMFDTALACDNLLYEHEMSSLKGSNNEQLPYIYAHCDTEIMHDLPAKKIMYRLHRNEQGFAMRVYSGFIYRACRKQALNEPKITARL